MPIAEILSGASIVTQLVGGLIGNIASAGDREKAERAAREAEEIINNLGAGPDLAKEILMDKFKEVGVYTPQIEQKVELEASKLSQLKEDPRLKEAQMQALRRFGREAEGRTPEFEAKLRQAEMQQRRAVAGQQLALQQQMAARGLGSSGALLGLQQQAIQSEADRAAMQSDMAAIEAQRGALEAARQYGGMAGQVRGQDFDVERTRLGAEDQFALQRFNEAMGRQQRNIAGLNAAQLRNLEASQRIADMNVSQANAERLRQMNAQQQMYQNQLTQAQLRAGVKSGQAQQYQQQAGTTQQAWTGIGSGIASGLSGIAGQMAASQRQNDYLDRVYGPRSRAVASAAAPAATIPGLPNPTSSSGAHFNPRTGELELGPSGARFNPRTGELELDRPQPYSLMNPTGR